MTTTHTHTITYLIHAPSPYPHRATCACGWISRGFEYSYQLDLVVEAHLEGGHR